TRRTSACRDARRARNQGCSGPTMRVSARNPNCEPLAQSVEHLPFKQRVAGSIPARLISATPARRLDGYRARHAVLVGSVRSHAIVFVTPEVRRAHALLRAAVSASRSVAPSTARHALLPPNSMHTSQRTPPAWRLV